MAKPNPSPRKSELVVGGSPTPPPPTYEGAGCVDPLLKSFNTNKSTSLSVEQHGSALHGRVSPSEEAGTQPGAIVCEETGVHSIAPVSAQSINVSHSLNSSPPCAAARITTYTPSVTKIEVKIEPPSLEDCSGDVNAYRLRYRELGSNGEWKTHNISTPANGPTTYTIESLQPGTSYGVQVAAVNSCGSGPFSMPLTECSTLQAPRAPNAVPKVSVSSTTDTIKVKIKPPPCQNCNGDIIAYRVQYKMEGRVEEWKTCDVSTTPNGSPTHIIERLQPATTYKIRVAAMNSSGWGPFTPENMCTTRQAPRPPSAAPRFTTSSTTDTIRVNIEPSSLEACPDDITSYRLKYKKQGSNGNWTMCSISSTRSAAPTHTIDSLQRATPYIIRVAAVNACGCGPFSPEHECTTYQAPSAAPRFTTSSTTDSVTVNIEPPPHQKCNGVIIGYKVQHRVVGANEDWMTYDVSTAPNAATTHTIQDLQPATSYNIRVAAMSSSGCGPFSREHECTTCQAPSAAPRFTTSSTTVTIRVNIEPPPHPNCNGDIIAYRVQHKVAGENREWETCDASTAPTVSKTHVIEQLEPATSYSIRVAAMNSSGCGPFSDEHECTTRQGIKKRALKVCPVVIGLVLLLLLTVQFFTFAFYHYKLSPDNVLYKNGSVLVGSSDGFKTFFQTAIDVKTSATSTSGLLFFRNSCNNLPTMKSTIIQVAHRNQQIDTETNIPLYYEYLVDGSTVCFHANITGERNLTDCAAAIYAFDDWQAYTSAFIDGNNITNNINKYCLNVSSIDQPNVPQCFRVPRPGFFFFGAYIPGKDQGLGVELVVIETVANRVLYNTSTLKPVCEIPSGEGTRHCSVELSEERKKSTSINMKICVLMTVQEASEDIQTLSYSSVPTYKKDFFHNLGTILSLTILAAGILVFILFVSVPHTYKVIRKRKNRQEDYQPLL